MLLAALAVVTMTGCGTEGLASSENAAQGERLFTQKCASCHTLAAAGAEGTAGPNLDDALGPLRTPELGGFDESTIRQVVHDQILYSAPPMPAGLVKGEDADAVAAFVASVAGKAGTPGAGPAVAAPAPNPGSVDQGQGAGGTGGTTGGGAGGTGGTTGGTATTGGTTGGDAAAADGKSIFSENCASCHALAAAGANGTIGPNLDDPKRPYGAVREQVANGGSGMPAFKGRLTDAEIDAVSRFVASNAGKK